ncbi:hypothetical protein EE612_000390 [Oryza sativa]|nr:hypothetical protein EE612_000390 [Oryza sativa]
MAYPSTISVTFSLLPRPSISHFANGHFNLQPPRRHPTASPARRWPERSLASQRPPAPPPPWTPLPAAAPASPRCAPSRTSSATSAPAAPPSSAPSPKVCDLFAFGRGRSGLLVPVWELGRDVGGGAAAGDGAAGAAGAGAGHQLLS